MSKEQKGQKMEYCKNCNQPINSATAECPTPSETGTRHHWILPDDNKEYTQLTLQLADARDLLGGILGVLIHCPNLIESKRQIEKFFKNYPGGK